MCPLYIREYVRYNVNLAMMSLTRESLKIEDSSTFAIDLKGSGLKFMADE